MLMESVVRSAVDLSQVKVALDLCAAPGGKSTHLRSILPDSALLVCNEIVPQRNAVLRENMAKWGHPSVIITSNDTADFANLEEYFDLILVDAPCSGEGMFRKDPVAIREWSEANVRQCAARQDTILESAIAALTPGGLIVYSTCTWSADEDEQVVDRVASRYGLEKLTIPALEGLVITENGARCYPHRVRGEGFFIAALRKSGTLTGNTSSQRSSSGKREAIPGSISAWCEPEIETMEFNGNHWGFPEAQAARVRFLKSKLHVTCAGVFLGELKGRDFVPSTELALSQLVRRDVSALDLEEAQALSFLRGDTLKSDTTHVGWVLVTFQGHPLGFAKSVQGRLNNTYPKPWRIRMSV